MAALCLISGLSETSPLPGAFPPRATFAHGDCEALSLRLPQRYTERMEAGQKKRRRVKMSRQVRVRPSDPADAFFDEVRSTVSVSPDGLFFTTLCKSYYPGMRLFVTYPHVPQATDQRENEYLSEVVSVRKVDDYRMGVAVRFLQSLSTNP